jgi:hypothetical protein
VLVLIDPMVEFTSILDFRAILLRDFHVSDGLRIQTPCQHLMCLLLVSKPSSVAESPDSCQNACRTCLLLDRECQAKTLQTSSLPRTSVWVLH